MARLLNIGIVGCGAIGSSLARVIVKDFFRQARLVALYDADNRKAKVLSDLVSPKRNLSVAHLGRLINKSELVIEAASAVSSWNIARSILSSRRDMMIMSVGGIIRHFKKLSSLANKFNAKVYIPSGAISGIDALKAARIGKIRKVTLTTTKNPLSFKGVEYAKKKVADLKAIKKDRTLFCGTAKDAVRYFPQNINVAAILSIAGLGEDKTRVKIVASPRISKNVHEIEIESEAARIFTRTENILHPDNPKTSYLAVLSAVAMLKQILEPIKIGT